MSKLLVFNEVAKQQLLAGVKIMADAVGTTLGPLGNNVALERKWSYPTVVHDGVTVAKEIQLEDPFMNMGAQMIREAASKTNDTVGDGTTTATILTHALVSEGLKCIEAGTNPMVLRRQINEAGNIVLDHIREQAQAIDNDQSEQIAIVSAQNIEIGKKVAEALYKVGPDGVVVIEEGTGVETTLEHKEGMEFEKGFFSPHFITDQDKQEARIYNPSILVTNHNISVYSDILPLLESVLQNTKDLVIICNKVEGEALINLVANNARGNLNILVIQPPSYGTDQEESLEDIAALVGARYIDRNFAKLTSVSFSDLGKASEVRSTSDSTVIIGGAGDVQDRIKILKTQLEKLKSPFDQERLKKRLAKLTSGAAIISIGAKTELELREKKERAIDALAATRAALEEGIIPSSASVLLKAVSCLEGFSDEGTAVVRAALSKPFAKLVENAGLDYLSLSQEVKSSGPNEGLDVTDGQVKDLVSSGVIDPVKVLRSALESALSVSGSILTTNVLIADNPEDKERKKEDD